MERLKKSRLAQRSEIELGYDMAETMRLRKNRSRQKLTTVIVEDVAKANFLWLHVGMRSGFLRARRVAGTTTQPAAPSKDDRRTDCGKGG